MRPGIGTLLISLGVIAIAIGLLANAGLLSWFGRLPGDVRIERENVRIYVPLVSMLIVSVILSVLLGLFRRL